MYRADMAGLQAEWLTPGKSFKSRSIQVATLETYVATVLAVPVAVEASRPST